MARRSVPQSEDSSSILLRATILCSYQLVWNFILILEKIFKVEQLTFYGSLCHLRTTLENPQPAMAYTRCYVMLCYLSFNCGFTSFLYDGFIRQYTLISFQLSTQ